MKLKIIINSLLIIFVLHLLLENIDYNYQIGKQRAESYENIRNNESINFLMDGETFSNLNSNKNMREELLDYVKNTSVEPSNMYEGNDNVPNFNSHVENVSKFYNKNYDNLSNLPTSQYSSVEKVTNRQEQNNTVQSDSWKYNNELPMNGGDMGGIFGYNNLESNYASFDDKTELDKCKNSTCVMNSDDIRMGLGYPNEENRDN